MKKFKHLVKISKFAVGALLLQTTLSAQKVDSSYYKGEYKFTYEKLELLPGEEMGLLGASTLFDLTPNWYGGASIYGAVEGERGGFFTLGVDSGLKTNLLNNIELRAGMFFGAGGGGGAPQGGGLMYRPYTELTYVKENASLGLGLSHIRFPNGDIEGTQLYLLASIPMDGNYLRGHYFSKAFDRAVEKLMNKSIKVSFLAEHYEPSNTSLNTDSASKTMPYSLAGVELDVFQNKNRYNFFQLAGAGIGDADGYMEVLAGLGYQYQLGSSPFFLDAKLGLGAAGGGRVDTGGGLVYRAEGGLNAQLSEHFMMGVKTGIMNSFGGTFKSQSYLATLGYTTAFNDTLFQSIDLQQAKPFALSMRILNKSYLDSDKLFKNAAKQKQVDLLGFALDSYINKNLYLTGQTFWAYDGEAGGYAEGIWGLGYHTNSYKNISLYTEGLIGVGGGGGIKVGSGLFASFGTGMTYAIDNNLKVSVGLSHVRGKKSTFSTTGLAYGLSYDFSLLGR